MRRVPTILVANVILEDRLSVDSYFNEDVAGLSPVTVNGAELDVAGLAATRL